MNTVKRQVLLTADGSHTLALENSDVTYHSRHGAITESRHVFIDAGLHYVTHHYPSGPVHVLEMGFGTGLNALLTAMEAKQSSRQIIYTSLETQPLTASEYERLNYGEQLHALALYLRLHTAEWNKAVDVDPLFRLQKMQCSLQDFSGDQLFHCIYFDAFAPGEQPELWTTDIFQKLYQQLLPGGVLVTYCSKSDVRRSMLAAGFTVSKLPGPPGKREMVRARKN